MIDAVHCRNCGEQFSQSARFCRGCGAPRAQNQARPPMSGYVPAPGGAPLPGYIQQPTDATPVSDGGRPWLLLLCALGSLVLVLGLTIFAIVLSNGGGGVHAATILTVTAPGASEQGMVKSSSGSDRGAHTSGSLSSPSPSGGAAIGNVGATESSAISLVAYRGRRFTVGVPSGWRIVEDEVEKEGYVESKWRDPTNPSYTVLVNASRAPHLSLREDAAPVHEILLKESDYRELYYGEGDLHGTSSWMWVFRVSAYQRIDYFFEKCTNGFGVLGSAPPARFSRLRATFRAVAQSVQSTCR